MRYLLALIALALLPCVVHAAVLPSSAYPIPKETHSGSGYTAIEVGLDGKVYIGTAVYGGSAHLVRFDPATKTWDDLLNVHQLTRDTGVGLDSQSKIHAKLLVGADGLIWAATKQGNEDFTYRPEYGESATGFPGAHLFSFNPKTGQIVDYGILKKQEGLIGGAIDNARKRLYFVSEPRSHFLIYDIARNSVRDLGRSGPSPRYMALDAKGRVFCVGEPLPGDPGPCLTMYDPAKDALYQLDVRVEGADPTEYKSPYVLVASADGTRLFGAGMSGKYVMDYDLSTVKLSQNLPYANGTVVCRLRGDVPPGDEHAGTLGKDGCFYFNSGPKLVRYDPKAGAATVLGDIDTPGAWQGVHAQGAAVGPDGTLYMKFLYPYQLLVFDKLTAPAGGI